MQCFWLQCDRQSLSYNPAPTAERGGALQMIDSLTSAAAWQYHKNTSVCKQNKPLSNLHDIQWLRKVFRPPSIFHSLLYCSHLLKSFKFIFFLINVHTAPHIDRKTQNCWHFCRFIKTEKLKYHMVLSIQTLCCATHIFNSGAVHFFWSSLRWFYTFIWVQLCLIILIGLD